MSNHLAASNTERSLQEDVHRAFSSLLSFVRKFLTSLLSFCVLLSKYMRRAINFNKNPNKPNEILPSTRALASDQSSSFLFLSLPTDIILNCLARVPRHNYPTIFHVSKSFRSFVLSPELLQMRFVIGKDYPVFYLSFSEFSSNDYIYHWFSFDPNEKKTSLYSSRILSEEKLNYCSSISIGSKIYFVGGYMYTSQNLWIFNSLSGEFCKGPNMKVARMSPAMAVVDGKLYVMGGYRQAKIQVEVFDLKTQTWEYGPVNPHGDILYKEIVINEAVSVEEKIYGTSHFNGNMIVYNTKDGRYETFEMPYIEDTKRRVCVINNVMYVYYIRRGLMWYDSKDKLWRIVHGLEMLISQFDIKSKMLECKGKLGFLWQDHMSSWRCAMVVLDKNGIEIHGTIEWSVLVRDVPSSYVMLHCLSVYE